MVYESDFYTTRRPYSRPLASSYTVTSPTVLPLSSVIQYFDDESREIRAKADALLRRIHVYVPRPSASDFHEDILPERFRSDDYIRRLLGARKNVAKEIEAASWYTVPEQRNLGKGNLACVAYVAGKPHSRRRPYYKLADLRASDVKSDVNLLSYYSKNREAAANACQGWRERVPELKEVPTTQLKTEEEAPLPELTED